MKTLIINYWNMPNVGGIETYLYNLCQYLLNSGERVIWFYKQKILLAESFKTVFLSEKVERYDIDKVLNTRIHIPFSYEEEIVILSFYPTAMASAEKLINLYKKDCAITPFYVIPNTTGDFYYIERYFTLFSNYVYKSMKGIIQRWETGNHIRFFAPQHIEYLQRNYNIIVSSPEEKLLRPVYPCMPLDMQLLDKKANRKEFIIISISRFDFPHKGYLLGLIRAYGRLKTRYSQIRLIIIGYGPDKPKVLREIESLPEGIRDDIKLVGEVPPNELGRYFKQAHLNISVAGAVGQGVKHGVLSLPARNYCVKECEVYGFFPYNIKPGTSLDPGNLVDSYIEDAIQMSKQKYIDLCVESYEHYNQNNKQNVDPLYFFNTVKICKPFESSKKEIRLLNLYNYTIRIILMLKKLFKLEHHEKV